MTVIAGRRQVGKGPGEVRTVFCLDCCRERQEGFFYHINLLNRRAYLTGLILAFVGQNLQDSGGILCVYIDLVGVASDRTPLC
jgi:hypothetical protein